MDSRVFIRINENNDVVFMHNKPFDEKFGLKKSESELLKDGILVNHIPEIDHQISGKSGIHKYNTATNEVYVEYVDRELTTEEKLELLQAQNNHLVETLDMVLVDLIPSLLGGGEIE